MSEFEISVFASIICIIITVIFSIIALICAIIEGAAKSTIYSTMAALFSALVTAISYKDIVVPMPIILPLNSETETYIDNVEVSIKSDKSNYLKIYYTLDGNDPEDKGHLYKDPIYITKSTTVCARIKFLWMWSEWTRESYKFEKILYDNQAIHSHSETSSLLNNSPDKNNDSASDTNVSSDNMTKPDNSEVSSKTEDESANSQDESSTMPDDEEASKPIEDSQPEQTPSTVPTATITEGINSAEGVELMNFINQYRAESGVASLTWNTNLEQEAQNLARKFATGEGDVGFGYYHVIARQCNGAKNAQRAVSDWITGNDYIPSESGSFIDANYTQIGGALYYLPNGNEYGYHYFWVICLM